ncbi:Hypothetical predicted protein [Paramuricea clavata]|uniref:Uncharacterized protein n=1 Tax=Paramuricea clavata TaxID=317549 RepID=A0A7D9KYM7_PARCT|nr:Hypothetical predicted protein [Paramuricea clavata]
MARMDLNKLKEKYNLREPERGDLDDTTIVWRSGKPDYAKANLAFLKGKTQNHKADVGFQNPQERAMLMLSGNSEYNVPADIEMQMFGDDQRSGSLATESNNKLPNSTNDNKDNDGKVNYETTPLSINGNSSIHEISIVETNKESSKENYKPWDQLIVSNNQRHNQNSLQQTNLISPQGFDQVEPNCDSNQCSTNRIHNICK